MTLPLLLRNWLAEVTLAALADMKARRTLEIVAHPAGHSAAGDRDLPRGFPEDLFRQRDGRVELQSVWAEYAEEFGDRSRRAWRALGDRPLDPPEASLAVALAAAAPLFDAGLYFEVHELLEPHWQRALGDERAALQGLIQIAVGFQHLANGNVAGARALLTEGSARTKGRRLHGLNLDPFTLAVRECLEQVVGGDARQFDWARVPGFPRL